jgi:3-oxoacyl-[acyl-carrier protein] reductase
MAPGRRGRGAAMARAHERALDLAIRCPGAPVRRPQRCRGGSIRAQLSGRVAIVTGAGGTRGIGRAIALGLGEAGCAVVVGGGRDAAAVADEITRSGARAIATSTDVSDPGSVEEMVEAARAAFGRIDVLVNNAGVLLRGTLADIHLPDWERSLAVNLTGVMLCTRAVARVMVAQGYGGRIVNISSLCAHIGCPTQVAYAATKGGVEGFTLAVAADLRAAGITVNALAPGGVYTNMASQQPPPEAAPHTWDGRPIQRSGLPQDVVGAAVFLASAEASWVTGAVLIVDGGQHLG